MKTMTPKEFVKQWIKKNGLPLETVSTLLESRIVDIVSNYHKNQVKNKALTKQCNIDDVSSSRFVSATCKGEKCSVCGKNATNKLGEEIPYDDPNSNRHNLTAYVCREHFRMIVGRLG